MGRDFFRGKRGNKVGGKGLGVSHFIKDIDYDGVSKMKGKRKKKRDKRKSKIKTLKKKIVHCIVFCKKMSL